VHFADVGAVEIGARLLGVAVRQQSGETATVSFGAHGDECSIVYDLTSRQARTLASRLLEAADLLDGDPEEPTG
jgi:hypothetical protein